MGRLCALVTALLLVAGCGSDSGGDTGGAAGKLDTLEPGKLQVAAASYMPYTAV